MSYFPNFHQVKSVRFLLACKLITYELTLEPINDWSQCNRKGAQIKERGKFTLGINNGIFDRGTISY